MRVTPENRVERLELLTRHAVTRTRRFQVSRHERERRAARDVRINQGKGLVVRGTGFILQDERGGGHGGWWWRKHGETADHRARWRKYACRHRAQSGRRTRVHFDIGGGGGGTLRPGLW
jgi:hypothetical protein